MTMDLELIFMSSTSVPDEQLIALINAVRDVNLKSVKSLLACGADANKFADPHESKYTPAVTDMVGEVVSPLIVAIKLLHPKSQCPSDIMMEIFDVLVDSLADVNNSCRWYQRTPIMYAAQVGNIRCVEKLIHKGAALHTADKFDDTVWTLAAKAGNVDMLKYLIEDHNIDKNSIDNDGFSILYFAVISDNIEVVRYLLKLGVTVTTYIPQQRRVATCKGCQQNIPCHFIYEMQRSSDPYIAAISNNMPEVIKLLEEHGCQLYKLDEVLSYAVSMNSVDVVIYLLCNHTYSLNNEYIAKYQWVDGYPHETLLISACQNISKFIKTCQRNSLKMVELLLEHGANPNMKRCVDKCPSVINIAIDFGHVEMIARLLRGGMDVNTRSEWDFNDVVLPFEAAVHKSDTYAAEMILVYGSSRCVHSLNDKHKLKTNIHPDLQELLKECEVNKNNVLPLKQRCQMVILNQLCLKADKKINELPLPTVLIKYLSIPEIDDILKMSNNKKNVLFK